MRHADIEVRSVGEIIDALRVSAPPRATVWFRGQPSAAWSLTPSLARDGHLLAQELVIIKRFIQLAIPQMTETVPAAADGWDWVFLMQHHNVPTRLLDWSESPLAAVWFALSNSAEDAVDAALWCLDPMALNAQARLRGRWLNELPAFGRDDILDNYLPDKQKDGAGAVPVAAIASRQFRRIAAQQGNFTISHSESDPVEEVGDGNHVWRLIIPAVMKPALREELGLLRYNELLLFPDLDRAAIVALESVR
jgi:hypothetical protein